MQKWKGLAVYCRLSRYGGTNLTMMYLFSAYTVSLIVSEIPEGVLHQKKIRNKVEKQLFEKLTTEPIKMRK